MKRKSGKDKMISTINHTSGTYWRWHGEGQDLAILLAVAEIFFYF